MAPVSQAPANVLAGKSGGKILKARTTARKTPYDRPTPPQTQYPLLQTESPSWLSGLVLPAKFVAGGASKILSSFWNPKSRGTSSSSSSDGDYESEDDSGDDEHPSDDVIELNQQKGRSSEKSETLHLIEQLLMLEHYSREERDRLIEIISSRVIDDSMGDGMGAGPSVIHSKTNEEISDIHNQAIMEAKKWVAEKKVRSSLKSDLDNGIYSLKSAIPPQTTEGEAGSPIDVAKSYMQTRPPWASPINHDKSRSPSPLPADLFNERTQSFSGGGISFSSAMRDNLSAGSWNIEEEIRRVRSKATEDMLSNHRSIANGKSINVVGRDEPINLETPKLVGEIVNLAAEGDAPGLSDIRTAQNDLPTEAVPSHPTMPGLEQYQKDDQQPDERNLDQKKDNNCFLMTESLEVPVVNNSQDSANTNDLNLVTKTDETSENRAVTRATRRSQRGKARGK